MMKRTGNWNIDWSEIKDPVQSFLKNQEKYINLILPFVEELKAELDIDPTITLISEDELMLSVYLNLPTKEIDHYVGLFLITPQTLQVLWQEDDYKNNFPHSDSFDKTQQLLQDALSSPQWQDLFNTYYNNPDDMEHHPYVSSNLDPNADLEDFALAYLWNLVEFKTKMKQVSTAQEVREFSNPEDQK